MSWPINTFVHPQSLRIQHRDHVTRHDGPQRKCDTGSIQWFAPNSTQTCSEEETDPSPGLDTKINKHSRYWRQFTRLVLENWHRRLIEKHRAESQSTHYGPGPQAATTWDEVVWKKQHIHHSLAQNNVSFTPLYPARVQPQWRRQLEPHSSYCFWCLAQGQDCFWTAVRSVRVKTRKLIFKSSWLSSL